MRVVSFLVFAATCGAVNLAHAPQLEIKDRTAFATAVLAELNTHLTEGGPADELLNIITDIRSRIIKAGDADKTGWSARQSECNIEIASLNAQLTAKKSDLKANLAKQVIEEGNIKAEKAAVVQHTEVRDEKIGNIADLDEIIRVLNQKRAYELEVFNNRTKDTEECIAAVKEIIELDGNSLLNSRQGDTEDSAVKSYEYERKSTDVNTVAVSAQNNLLSLTSHMSAGAKSVMSSAVDSSANYDDLASLLTHLAEELDRYKVDLTSTEATAVTQHANDIKDANAERADRVVERDQAETQRGLAYGRQQVAEGKLASLKVEEGEFRSHIKDLEDTISTWTDTCEAQRTEFNTRVSDRGSELDTLVKIEALVKEKLGHLLDGAARTATQEDVAARVDGVTSE